MWRDLPFTRCCQMGMQTGFRPFDSPFQLRSTPKVMIWPSIIVAPDPQSYLGLFDDTTFAFCWSCIGLACIMEWVKRSVYFQRQFIAACPSTLTYAHSWQRPCTPATRRSIHHTLPSLATKMVLRRISTWCLSQDTHRSLHPTIRNVVTTVIEL